MMQAFTGNLWLANPVSKYLVKVIYKDTRAKTMGVALINVFIIYFEQGFLTRKINKFCLSLQLY